MSRGSCGVRCPVAASPRFPKDFAQDFAVLHALVAGEEPLEPTRGRGGPGGRPRNGKLGRGQSAAAAVHRAVIARPRAPRLGRRRARGARARRWCGRARAEQVGVVLPLLPRFVLAAIGMEGVARCTAAVRRGRDRGAGSDGSGGGGGWARAWRRRQWCAASAGVLADPLACVLKSDEWATYWQPSLPYCCTAAASHWFRSGSTTCPECNGAARK